MTKQRLIRFRVWDKKKKKMVYDDNINFVIDFSGGIWETAVGDFEGGGLLRRDLAVMQYTGLRDKNGKKIFEGDIIKATINWGEFKDRKLAKIFEVRRNGLEFTPLAQLEREAKKTPGGKNIYEVIGNIYENKSLLNEQKEEK